MNGKDRQDFEIDLTQKTNVMKRGSKEKGTILNEWESLTAPSNRRLNPQTLRFFEFSHAFKLKWSIDRITIVGRLREIGHWHNIVTEDGEILKDFKWQPVHLDYVMGEFEEQGGAVKASNGWNLVDRYGENIAYLEILPYPATDENGDPIEKGRIDFNPNKIGQSLKMDLKTFIHKIFTDAHFSRADVACDILNAPDEYVRQYGIADAVSFRPYYNKSHALETGYWGARSSEKQVRLYNKKVEQERKKKIVPLEIATWWRFEAQLRRDSASNWVKIVYDILDKFYNPACIPLDWKVTDKIMLEGLYANPQRWGELSENTRRKYRKMQKQVVKEDELAQHMKSSFLEHSLDLSRQLDAWLTGMDVTRQGE